MDSVELGCFGHYATIKISDACLRGCPSAESCKIATHHIPFAPISELAEYLVASNHSLRCRARKRLEELMHP